MTAELFDFNKAKRQGEVQYGGVDVEDIRDRLHANPRSFVEWLFSGRAFVHKNSSEARIGNVQGEPGASLSIQLSGQDSGLWKDHATEEGGDLIELYRSNMGYAKGSNFELSLKEIAKEFFNDPIEIERGQWQPSAIERIEKKKAILGTKPRPDMLELGAPVATYPYYDTRGNVTASVVRYEPDGTRENKTFRPYCFKTVEGATKWIMGTPDLRPLYRLPEISLASTIVLVEGEGKAQALASVGIEATSAMQGANAPIEKTDWSPLHGKTVIVWPDNDEPGFKYGRAAAERLAVLGCTVKLMNIPADKPAKWDAGDCVAAGEDPRQLIETAFAFQASQLDQGVDFYRLYTLEELENLPPPEWIVDGLLTEGGLSLIWAGSDQYKTFVAIDIAMSVATGSAWHGHAVKGGPVIYVAAEDESGVKMRMIGWRETRGKGLPKANVRIQRDGLSLATPEGEKLLKSIVAISKIEKPVLIIIDTLQRTFGAGNENQTQDMNAYVLAADRLKNQTGANVMIIHHSGRNSDRERGNLVLRGSCDSIFTIERSGDRIKLINQPPKGKQKNSEPSPDLSFRMQKVFFELKGKERSTLLLMDDENPPQKTTEAKPDRKFNDTEKDILRALKGGQMGLMRITAITKRKKTTVLSALSRLCAVDQIRSTRSEDGKREEWTINV